MTHSHAKASYNLPWRCLRQQPRLSAHLPSSTFLQMTALIHLITNPHLTGSGPSPVRANCASMPFRLSLCISITEDLGKNSGMPAHLICYGNTCGQSMWQRDTADFCLHLRRCREEQRGPIKTTLSIHANVWHESRRIFSILTLCLLFTPHLLFVLMISMSGPT